MEKNRARVNLTPPPPPAPGTGGVKRCIFFFTYRFLEVLSWRGRGIFLFLKFYFMFHTIWYQSKPQMFLPKISTLKGLCCGGVPQDENLKTYRKDIWGGGVLGGDFFFICAEMSRNLMVCWMLIGREVFKPYQCWILILAYQ